MATSFLKVGETVTFGYGIDTKTLNEGDMININMYENDNNVIVNVKVVHVLTHGNEFFLIYKKSTDIQPNIIPLTKQIYDTIEVTHLSKQYKYLELKKSNN